MNRKILLGAGGIIIVGLVIIAFGLRGDSAPKEEALRTPEVKEVKIEEETPQYKITVSYPQFYNLDDPVSVAEANSIIKEKVQKSTDAFKNASQDAVDVMPGAKSEMSIKYEIVYLNSWVASIKMLEDTYTEGATHPLGIFWSFNYNFKDNREIVLRDLFNPDSNYLSVLSDLSRESLKNQLKEYYVQESVEFGTEPRSENFSAFFLDKDKLMIIFNVYQVIGYAAGPQRVEIPYEKLAGVINSQGVIQLVRQ